MEKRSLDTPLVLRHSTRRLKCVHNNNYAHPQSLFKVVLHSSPWPIIIFVLALQCFQVVEFYRGNGLSCCCFLTRIAIDLNGVSDFFWYHLFEREEKEYWCTTLSNYLVS